jgi:hypothetical protein
LTTQPLQEALHDGVAGVAQEPAEQRCGDGPDASTNNGVHEASVNQPVYEPGDINVFNIAHWASSASHAHGAFRAHPKMAPVALYAL